MKSPYNRETLPRHRPAMTLVELLVVLAIITILMAVAAPLVRNSSRDRRVREASRALSGYINGVRTLAAQRGRPVGIWIERFQSEQSNGGMYSTAVFTAEVPPPYTGNEIDSKSRLYKALDPDDGNWKWRFIFTPSDLFLGLTGPQAIIPRSEDVNSNGVRDTGEPDLNGNGKLDVGFFAVRFDYRGPVYPARRNSRGDYFLSGSVVHPPERARKNSVPFQIYLPPRKSLQQPLQLPAETAIDLSVSGFGATGREFGSVRSAPVVILFEPSGDLASTFYAGQEVLASTSVHILVGRSRQVIGSSPPTSTGPGLPFPRNLFVDDMSDYFLGELFADLSNLMDMSTLWVTISHRTGQVSTTENSLAAWNPGPDGAWGVVGTDDDNNGQRDDITERGWPGSDDVAPRIIDAREFARGKINKGGR